MTLDDLNEIIAKASGKAHLFMESLGMSERVCSASLRIDDDGVMTVILHKKQMPGRVPSDESEIIRGAISTYNALASKFGRNPENHIANFEDEYISEDVLWDFVTENIDDSALDDEFYATPVLDHIKQAYEERKEFKRKWELSQIVAEVETEPEQEDDDEINN